MDPVTRWLVLLIPVLSPALQTAAGLDFLEIRDRPKNYFYSPGMYYPPSRTLEKCTSNAYRRTGICTTMSGCPMYGGAPSGWCGYADILCCVLIASCNRVVSLNNTYVLNPGYPKQINKSIECTLEVRIIPKNVKQIRLEFINFHLAPPNTTTGECTTDILIITGGTKMDLGICGSFTGQHLYYDVNGDIMFNFTLGKANFNRLWEINIIQLEAQQQAPAACLQYIQQSAGMFYTMNYMLNGIHVMSYDFYLICIRRAKNMCSLVSSSCDGNVYHSFMVLKNSNNKSTRTFDFMVQFGPNGPSKIPMLNNGMCIRFEQKEQCMQNIESKAIQESQDLRCKEITRICRKAEQKRLQTRMISESEEQKLYADIQEAKASQERNLAELEQEHKLAQLMADIKHKEIVDLKTNQLIRNNCLELRCAEKQIRTDDATKILLNQIKEKETLKKEEKVRNYYTDLKMLEASKNWFKSEAELQNRKNQMNLDYKNALLDQIKEGTEKQLKLSPIIPTEDQPIDPRENCLKQKNELVECYRKEIEEFTKIKNERKDNERKENDIQDKRIEEYLMEVEKRRRHEEKCKQKKQEEKDTIYNYLVDLKLSATKSCEDSDIQNRLISQQRLNDSWLAAKHEKEMKIQRRDEMINQNEMQLKFKMDQMKKEKENEFIESQKILQSYEQSKIVEAKKYSDKRQSMIEYGNELRKTIEQRSILRDEQKKRLQTNTYE